MSEHDKYGGKCGGVVGMQALEAVEHEQELWYPWAVHWNVGDKEYSTTIFARSESDAKEIVQCMRLTLRAGDEVLATAPYIGSVTKH